MAAVAVGPPGKGAAPLPAETAVGRGEHTLAVVVAVARAGSLMILTADVLGGHWNGRRLVTLTVLAAIAGLDSLALIAACLVVRRLHRGLIAFDMACVIAVVGLTAVPAIFPGPPGESPFYNFAEVATITFGLPAWRLMWTLAGAGALAAANVASAVEHGSRYPLWNAVPDSVTFVAVALVAHALARVLRNSARSLDKHHRLAIERAAGLAMEHERARQQVELRAKLLSTVEELADGDAVADARMREQVRGEADWLRQVVTAWPPLVSTPVLTALRELAAEKIAAGLWIDLELGHEEADLPAASVVALVEAAREALTNVSKHAGTGRATLHVFGAEGGLTVEVADSGRGYDPATTRTGTGQRLSIHNRMADVGGRAEIDSCPSAGTRVRLWAPGTT